MPQKKNDFDEIKLRIYNPFNDYDSVAQIWCAMLSRCPHSFFLSWGWISIWLKTLPDESDIELIVGEIAGYPIIAFFLGKTKIVRHCVFSSQTITLNATGKEQFDNICIEYNDILVDPSCYFNFSEFLSNVNLPMRWDEFVLPGVAGRLYEELAKIEEWGGNKNKYNAVIHRDEHVFWVDLQKVRDNNMDYLQLLSANSRRKIRKSIRAYEEKGKIQIEVAESAEVALDMLDELAQLHQKTWKKRGLNGAFSMKYFHEFHKELINHCYDKGEVQILRIYNSYSTIGYLYTFIYEDNVLFYQCAFNFLKNNKFSPGLTALVYAILLYADKNYQSCNFLAGNVQYKKSLATDNEKMCWVTIQKKRKRFFFEKKLKKIKFWIEYIQKYKSDSE